MKVAWKNGSRIKCSPAKAHAVVEKNRKENGGSVDLEALWLSQKDKEAPLHGEFEWNKTAAWKKYNTQRAGYIVRSIEVIRSQESGARIRAYESVVEASDAGEESTSKHVYRRTEDILADPVARDQLLASAIRDALAFKRRYAALSELSKIIQSMDDFLDDAATG